MICAARLVLRLRRFDKLSAASLCEARRVARRATATGRQPDAIPIHETYPHKFVLLAIVMLAVSIERK